MASHEGNWWWFILLMHFCIIQPWRFVELIDGNAQIIEITQERTNNIRYPLEYLIVPVGISQRKNTADVTVHTHQHILHFPDLWGCLIKSRSPWWHYGNSFGTSRFPAKMTVDNHYKKIPVCVSELQK